MAKFDKSLFEQLDSLTVLHPAFTAGRDAVTRALENSQRFHDRSLLPVIGPSRCGKTRLVEICMASYIAAHGEDPKRASVRYVPLPRSKHPKAVLMKLQHRLGYPLFYVGSEETMQIRCLQLLDRLKVHTLIFDEKQHCVSQEGTVNFAVADLFKVLLDEAGVAVIGSGLEEAAAVLEANEQLTGRCSQAVRLPRFLWIDKKSRADFIAAINGFGLGLPSLRLPDFTNDDLAFAWYIASGGLIGIVHKIFRQILLDAERDSRMRVTLEDLDAAYAVAVYRRGGPEKPFTREFKKAEVAAALDFAARIGERVLPAPREPAKRGHRRTREELAHAAVAEF
ncbi:MAG TPA: TniB family NTP-binding protein [Albitalea sp.]|uniref:TniB family NTP-binding protein n=1 Tax=Piscinibacter sp. TaxID=1903157 RepID=UPI002ED058D4